MAAQQARSEVRFGRDERGATLIEFALLAPIFFAILAAILQTSMLFLSGQVLESAVHDASRAIRTGQAQQTGWNLAAFRTDMCGRLYGLLECSGLHIEVNNLTDFQSANTAPPVDADCEEDCGWTREESWLPGGTSSIVLVQVHYKYPLIVPVGKLSPNSLPDGRLLLGAATVFRNEPF